MAPIVGLAADIPVAMPVAGATLLVFGGLL
jgi:hypothetical protein